MSTIETGGPAFPLAEPGNCVSASEGMSLRDYFAAKAMMLAFEKAIHNWRQDGEEDLRIDYDFVAESAYRAADAMLKARDEQP